MTAQHQGSHPKKDQAGSGQEAVREKRPKEYPTLHDVVLMIKAETKWRMRRHHGCDVCIPKQLLCVLRPCFLGSACWWEVGNKFSFHFASLHSFWFSYSTHELFHLIFSPHSAKEREESVWVGVWQPAKVNPPHPASTAFCQQLHKPQAFVWLHSWMFEILISVLPVTNWKVKFYCELCWASEGTIMTVKVG